MADLLMRALLFILAACAPTVQPQEPNTSKLCQAAVDCHVFAQDELAGCVACLEHWADQLNADIEAELIPPYVLDCQLLAWVAMHKRIAECVAEEWWKR